MPEVAHVLVHSASDVFGPILQLLAIQGPHAQRHLQRERNRKSWQAELGCAELDRAVPSWTCRWAALTRMFCSCFMVDPSTSLLLLARQLGNRSLAIYSRLHDSSCRHLRACSGEISVQFVSCQATSSPAHQVFGVGHSPNTEYSEMSQQGAQLQGYNNELIKCKCPERR